jgi:cytidylate kinase
VWIIFSMIIAIDGPAGSGKSSTAKLVAARLGFLHLDTGAMYRAITLKCLRKGLDWHDDAGIADMLKTTDITFTGAPPSMKVWMDGEDVSTAVRGDEVTKNVSDYCRVPVVRNVLVDLQRKIGNTSNTVCEGRDIGTVVFSKAELKFFMVASVEERAKRLQKDFEKIGVTKSIGELVTDIEARDHKDSTRDQSPLVKAHDAIELDTTNMSLDEQVQFIVDKAKMFLKQKS